MTSVRLAVPRRSLGLLGAVVALGAMAPAAHAATATVCSAAASDEVQFVAGELPDAADDAAIFIHPTDKTRSTYIGVNKLPGTGLSVYNMSGTQIQFIAAGSSNRWNNDDLRYNFPLGGKKVALLAATNRQQNTIDFWTINESTGLINPGLVGSISVTGSGVSQAHGLALYHSPVSGKYYAFVTYQGKLAQFELDGSSGKVTGKLVRGSWALGEASEGLVVDDERQAVYLAKETSAATTPDDTGGIDRFGAEPGDSKVPFRIDSTTDNKKFTPGHIKQDVKGLAMYYGANGSGYLVAASQGGDDYHVYDRAFTKDVPNTWRGSVAVNGGSCPSQDKLTATDGIDVTNVNLGGAFATGMFVVQDDKMDGGTQNYKMVPWGSIASALHLSAPDTSFDPRSIGGDGTPWTPPADDGGNTGGNTGGNGATGGTGCRPARVACSARPLSAASRRRAPPAPPAPRTRRRPPRPSAPSRASRPTSRSPRACAPTRRARSASPSSTRTPSRCRRPRRWRLRPGRAWRRPRRSPWAPSGPLPCVSPRERASCSSTARARSSCRCDCAIPRATCGRSSSSFRLRAAK